MLRAQPSLEGDDASLVAFVECGSTSRLKKGLRDHLEQKLCGRISGLLVRRSCRVVNVQGGRRSLLNGILPGNDKNDL
jgi:hypothetical protein